MKFISTKELRTSLPVIRRGLSNGEDFFVIFQSKLIARLSPVDQIHEVSDSHVERAALADASDEYLSKKELNYYLSLS